MAEVQTMPAVEVPEPDLSMEVQDQLRRSLTDNEVRFFAALDEEQETPVLETASSRAFAGYAVGEAVRMLKKFNPEATHGTNAKALALNPAAQATSAGAAGGSVTVGAAGGGLGLLAGGAAGAAVGLVPALFTFGLSIPVCAAIGGGAGACLGTAAGGTTGFVGGGAVGYGAYNAYSQRKEISLGASEALTKLGGMAESVKEGAKERANMSASFIKARLSGTGGTQ
jgi:hypothetical protein